MEIKRFEVTNRDMAMGAYANNKMLDLSRQVITLTHENPIGYSKEINELVKTIEALQTVISHCLGFYSWDDLALWIAMYGNPLPETKD